MRKVLEFIAVYSLCYMVACSSPYDTAPTRTRESFDNDWLFLLSNVEGAEAVEYDDSDWRRGNLPHDWAIEGDFSADNPSGYAG